MTSSGPAPYGSVSDSELRDLMLRLGLVDSLDDHLAGLVAARADVDTAVARILHARPTRNP